MKGQEQLKNIAVFVPDATILSIGEAGTGANAEGVPEDHRRYVYWMKLWTPGAAVIVSIYENVAGVLQRKDIQILTQYQTLQFPAAGPQVGPDGEPMPIMGYRGSSFIQLQLSTYPGTTTSGVGVNMLFMDKPGGA